MGVQILGARMLAPFLGTSHFVWTAQIAVTMVALACGYYLGGRAADKAPRIARLYLAIGAAALYLAVALWATRGVAFWALEFRLPVGSLLASLILYFVPLALLATAAPFLVRFVTASVAVVGVRTGTLNAIATAGSFVGTMLIGYVMIPLMPNAVAMYVTIALLFALAAGYCLFTPQKGMAIVPALFALGTGLALVPQLDGPGYRLVKKVYRGNSHFGTLQVIDRLDGSCRYYLNDNLIQNTYSPQTGQSMSMFTYMLSGLARAYTTNIESVLCIGLGIGIVPREFASEGARADVVEINPAIVPVASNYFGFDPLRVNLTIDDGRRFLNRSEAGRYDAVVLDAFLGDSSPSHLMTREAFSAVRRVLRPGGVLVINSFTDPAAGRDFFAASLQKTLEAVFPGVRLHSDSDGAIFFVAGDRSPLDPLRQPDFSGAHPEVREETRRVFNTRIATDPEHGLVLTDDYNPVEFYDAGNRESIRRRLAQAVRQM